MSKEIKILYVDDDEPNLDSFDLILGEQYSILIAESGKEALELLAKEKNVGVVIADWKMPEMNGSELIHKIKEKYPEIICIMFTAYISFELANASVNDPAIFKYIEKPMDYAGEEFQQVLGEAIAEHKKLKK